MRIFSQFLFLGLVVLGLSANTYVYAEDDGGEYKNMEQMMGSIKLEKKQVESMIEKLVVSGRITREEGVEASRALASMKENDLETLKTKAIAEVKSQKLLDH